MPYPSSRPPCWHIRSCRRSFHCLLFHSRLIAASSFRHHCSCDIFCFIYLFNVASLAFCVVITNPQAIAPPLRRTAAEQVSTCLPSISDEAATTTPDISRCHRRDLYCHYVLAEPSSCRKFLISLWSGQVYQEQEIVQRDIHKDRIAASRISSLSFHKVSHQSSCWKVSRYSSISFHRR